MSTMEIVGGGFDGLLRAVDEVRRGGRVTYIEPGLRAGGALVTESFLSPFRFNLGPTLVLRPPLPSLEVLAPEKLVGVGSAMLERTPLPLTPGGDVPATLDGSGVDGDRRTLLAAFALLLGIDPAASTSGARLADACARIDELVLVGGGNGLATACLVDEIVAAGSQVVEGTGPPDLPPTAARSGLGICRLFVGLRRARLDGEALATAHGFSDEPSLYARLDMLRGGDVSEPLGFDISNAHLDANAVDPALSSFVWQGVLPFGAALERANYAAAVLDRLGIDERDVLFQLLWLPEDTAEPLH
jgi:hypothetical protein